MSIEEITVAEARVRQQGGAILIDVREPDEHALGIPASARRVPRAKLEANASEHIADPATDVLLICGSGKRSMLAAQNLAAQGYRRLSSVAGGYQQWLRAGLPIETAQDPDYLERYSRHLRLPQVGAEGQAKLARARALVVGAGGLGSPAAFYLAAAGVGFLRLVDDDVVDRSNLQRQILHTDARIGSPKVESAALSLRALNPTIEIETVQARVSADNVENLLRDVDVVLDGADNFPTRYLLSDACVHLAKPMVYGAVQRFDGQVSVFDAGRHRGSAPCYRCLFPQPPSAADAPNCADAGVLGVLPGLIGLLQATEVLKLILGIGEPLTGRLLQFDALGLRFREAGLRPDPDCVVCAPGAAFIGYPALQQLCAG
ncbi:molybdopterin-synthase adenylyltransferase MoeB [Arenimonas sp.]|uniref:molybdopterin-synthase adenylyltransferase MoeB n=1 Tax=Arenimonas sp. TaxID=1872635 RepID=UPI0039E23EA4